MLGSCNRMRKWVREEYSSHQAPACGISVLQSPCELCPTALWSPSLFSPGSPSPTSAAFDGCAPLPTLSWRHPDVELRFCGKSAVWSTHCWCPWLCVDQWWACYLLSGEDVLFHALGVHQCARPFSQQKGGMRSSSLCSSKTLQEFHSISWWLLKKTVRQTYIHTYIDVLLIKALYHLIYPLFTSSYLKICTAYNAMQWYSDIHTKIHLYYTIKNAKDRVSICYHLSLPSIIVSWWWVL